MKWGKNALDFLALFEKRGAFYISGASPMNTLLTTTTSPDTGKNRLSLIIST
jgi:hypothetical protein